MPLPLPRKLPAWTIWKWHHVVITAHEGFSALLPDRRYGGIERCLVRFKSIIPDDRRAIRIDDFEQPLGFMLGAINLDLETHAIDRDDLRPT